MADPQTTEEWLRLAQGHQDAAARLLNDQATSNFAIGHIGFSAEAALKAYIMRRERFNSWPSISARRDLYTHDLRVLLAIAGIPLDPLAPTAPSWHVILQFDRNQQYDPRPMPTRVAASWFEAAFGQDGVVSWIRKTFP